VSHSSLSPPLTQHSLRSCSFYARQAAGGKIDIPDSWSLWSKLQIVVVLGFLFFFAGGFDVSTVSISAGVVLMTLMAWKRQSFDAKPEPESEPKKMYDVAGNEIEPEEEELITESETTLTVVDYGLLLLFIGQFLLIGSFDDTGLPQAFFAVAMGGCAADMTSVPCVYWLVARSGRESERAKRRDRLALPPPPTCPPPPFPPASLTPLYALGSWP